MTSLLLESPPSHAVLERNAAGLKAARDVQLSAAGLVGEIIDLAQSAPIAEDWQRLADAAIEPNPFYARAYLLALKRHIFPSEQRLVLVWKARPERKLVGLFPVAAKGLSDGCPLPVCGLSYQSFIGICTPLIDSDDPVGTWRCFMETVTADPRLPDVVQITEFYTDGPCGRALTDLVKQGQAFATPTSSFARAVATSNTPYADYTARWSKKKKRNITSRRKKLEAMGALSFQIVDQSNERFEETLAEVLALEAAGWKGVAGTALASNPNTLGFAHDACKSAQHDGPTTHLAVLRQDGRLIAGQVNLIAQDTAFFLKSGYEESLSKYGPGVLLYAWVLEQALEQGLYTELDSCADAGHQLEEIWLERKTVQTLFLAASDGVGYALPIAAYKAMQWLRQAAKTLRKALR